MARWLEVERVFGLARRFGAFLPMPIVFEADGRSRPVSGEGPPWRSAGAGEAAIRRMGAELFEQDFVDFFPLRSERSKADGIAFVRTRAVDPTARHRHNVYLKGMLLSEACDNLLPPWAGFVHAVVDAKELRPTASREQLYEDEALAETRMELGACVKSWLISLPTTNALAFERLFRVHDLSMKAYALHDDEFLEAVGDHFVFETASGYRSRGDLRRVGATVTYAETVDEFRQLAPVAIAQGIALVNAGHTYEVALLERAAQRFSDLRLHRLDAEQMRVRLDELSTEQQAASRDFLESARAALRPLGVEPELRSFHPASLPALYVQDEAAWLGREARRLRDAPSSLWGGVVHDVVESVAPTSAHGLVFNIRNPLIRRLHRVADPGLLALNIRVIYVQTLLHARKPLTADETTILNDGLLELLERTSAAAGEVLQ